MAAEDETSVRKGVVLANVSEAQGKPDYVLLLKLRPDGRYERVSGQDDPALSFRKTIYSE
jgi:hypothetical protein